MQSRKTGVPALVVPLVALALIASGRPARADIQGTWEGRAVFYNGPRIAGKYTYDWDNQQWPVSAGRKFGYEDRLTLDLQGDHDNLTGQWTIARRRAGSTDDFEKLLGVTTFPVTATFDSGFKELTIVIRPPGTGGKYMPTGPTVAKGLIYTYSYSRDGDFEYLRLHDYSLVDNKPGGRIWEYRRKAADGDIKDDAPKHDFVQPEADASYAIKRGEFHLELNDTKDGIVAKKEGEARKWKFVAAPEEFKNAFRIVPADDDSKCLQPSGDGDGNVKLVDKDDSLAEGEQFWRFETSGDGVLIANVKYGGRGLHIEDEDSGQTILRSRREASKNPWKLEKQ